MLNRDSKFKDLYEMLKGRILSNSYSIENPIPSVRALMQKSGFSSTTVRRVLEALEREGLISCCKGSGSFVTPAAVSRKIGLVVPGVAYSEFFPPIVSEISRLAQERNYTLLFADMTAGSSEVRARKAKRFARELVREKAAGVIYQPLEFLDDADSVNREIVSVFDESHIPVELLDYDIVSPPERSQHDVIGINNVDAGYRLACHLMDQGARKIHFLMRPNWAPSVRNRLRGAISALNSGGGGK